MIFQECAHRFNEKCFGDLASLEKKKNAGKLDNNVNTRR